MLNSISHRGPDDFATYFDLPFVAGMRRLAINGLADGHQPLFNESKDIVLFYNGEIYNSSQLRKELIRKGYRFSTHSDGEVICHLYEDKGIELFRDLDGMFAVALWIKSEKKLILARDFIGEKPLYYAKRSTQELVFASEIKALKACNELTLTLNEQAIWDFPTFLWIPEPATIYQEIQALPAGSLLIADESGIKLQSYLSQNHAIEIPDDFTAEDISKHTREIIKESVQSRLMSEVPLGCFLSGGLDSSIVTTLCAQHLENINTFSIGFEDLVDPYHGKSDESEDAQYLANRLGTKHHAIHVTAKDFKELLPSFCHYGDQPFAVSSGLGILKIAKMARELGIKVLLSGDGADELFGGYSWYQFMQQLEYQNQHNLNQETTTSFQSFGLPPYERLKIMSQYPFSQQAWAWHYYAHEKEKAILFSQEWQQSTKITTSIRHFSALDTLNTTHFPMAFLENDRQFYFPNEMLTKVDRMCMAHSIESRVPFASKKVTDWARSIPYEILLHSGTLKWPLRDAFKELIPDEVLKRPKHGFNVPIDHWLKNEWKDLYQHTFSHQSALFKHGFITRETEKHATRMLNDAQKLNGHTLFCYIMLNMWLENEYNRNYC